MAAKPIAAPASAADGLLRAYQLAPQDHEVRMQLAGWLLRERRYSDVAVVLEPVAYAPHASRFRDEAAALLDRIRPLADGAVLPPAPAPSSASTS